MSKEAMKLALEALELNNDEWKSLADSGDSGYWKAEDQDHYQQTNKAITALREALAEPQEKYIYGTPLLDAMTGKASEALDKKAENARELGLDYEPAQDSGIVTAGGFDPRTQRTWVGLTDEDIDYLCELAYENDEELILTVQAKLKEKNT